MFIGLFALILINVPIAISLAVVAVVAMLAVQGIDILPNVALVMYDGSTKFSLLAIPLFIFAGAITNIVGLVSPFPGGIGAREITIYVLYDLYFGLGGIALLAILAIRILTYFGLFLLFFSERGLARLFHSKSLNEVNVA